MGRGGAAPHHPAAAQDHGGVKEVGEEETVSGPDNLRRPSGCASAPQTQRRPGHSLHQGSSYADQHLGQLAEAEAHQRSRAGQPAIPLLLEAAQPARAERRGGAQRPAAEGAALPAIRAGDAGTLQFPLCLLPEAEE